MSHVSTPREVTPEEVQARLECGDAVRLVDVRQACEYVQYHIPGVLLMPLGELSARFASELDLADSIVCICEHGVRSRSAAQFLAGQGYQDVATMTGGMAEYHGPVEAGMPEDTEMPEGTGTSESLS